MAAVPGFVPQEVEANLRARIEWLTAQLTEALQRVTELEATVKDLEARVTTLEGP